MQKNFRHKIVDSQGQVKSLENSFLAYTLLFKSSNSLSKKIILLGLGPQPQNFTANFTADTEIYYVECPQFLNQLPETALQAQNLKALSPETLSLLIKDFLQNQVEFAIYFYQADLKLFPEFWSSILAKTQLCLIPKSSNNKPSCIVIAGSKKDLLSYELLEACQENNLLCTLYNPQKDNLLNLFQNFKIELFLTVNMRGLSSENLALCQEAQVPVAIWFVDNPYNIVNPKLQNWQKQHIFVSCSEFCKDLQKMGVINPHFLPLASSLSLAKQAQKNQNMELFFAGRSVFPNFQSYFAALKANIPLQELAENLIAFNFRPDFYWWENKLNTSSKEIALNTELANLTYRRFWLNNLSSKQLTVAGDQAWQEHLDSKIQLIPAVDYYTSLFSHYKSADFSLNLTSLLLPQGLTQRHFDVWLAGGFLLSDYTEDMNIFSSQAHKYSASAPEDLLDLLTFYQSKPEAKAELQTSMQKEIQDKHLYKHRLQSILQIINT